MAGQRCRVHPPAGRTIRLHGELTMRTTFWFTASFVFVGLTFIIIVGALHR
jgi:hypothetical protein